MKIWVFIIITLHCTMGALYAQEEQCGHEIEISVIESGSGLPVSAASVAIEGSPGAFLADELGHLTLRAVCKGKLVLLARAIGYELQGQDLWVEGSSRLTLILNPSNISLKEVRVSAQKGTSTGTHTSTTIAGRELEQTKGGTLADAIKSIPGVSVLQTGATISKPVIQGLHSNRILIVNNGIRQEGQQWGMEHGPEIDPFIASNITVIKGADAVRFGPDALGGVILVEPAILRADSVIHGELSMTGSTNGRGGALSGRLDGGIGKIPGLAWRVQGTGRRSGNIKTPTYFMGNTGVEETGFSAGLGYTRKRLGAELYFSHFNTDIGIFRGSHIGNLEDLQARISYGQPLNREAFSYAIDAPRQHVEHSLLKLKGHVHLNNNTHLDYLYGLQHNKREEYDVRRGGRSSLPSLDLSLTSQTLDLSIESINKKGWKKTAGIKGLLQVNNNVPGTLATPLIPNFDTYNVAAYLITKLIKPKYELEAGVSYDHKYLDALGYDKDQVLYGGSRRFNNLSASIAVTVHPTKEWSFRSNLGSTWRPPSVNELYSDGLHHGSASYERGKEDLATEKSYKWVSSAEYTSEKLKFQLSIFFNYINNYIYLEPTGELYESIRGSFPTFDYQQTNARFTGTDLGLTYNINPLFIYELKGALVRATDVRSHAFLPWIPSDKLENSLGIQRHKRSGAESYLKISHLFVARQKRYEVGSDYSFPPGSYHLINLTAGHSFKFHKNRLSFNTSLNNIANSLYKEYMNRFRYYAHEQGRNLTIRALFKF